MIALRRSASALCVHETLFAVTQRFVDRSLLQGRTDPGNCRLNPYLASHTRPEDGRLMQSTRFGGGFRGREA
jgi:hypothetical protein